MKSKIVAILQGCLEQLCLTDESLEVDGLVAPSENIQRGDYSSPVALLLFKRVKHDFSSPLALAEHITKHCNNSALASVTASAPGYINFTLSAEYKAKIINSIISLKDKYGLAEHNHKKVLLEYLSANPTGPLHVGRARGAVVGMALANILKSAGYTVVQEYYVNDGGHQINTLLLSVIYCIENIPIPDNGYDNEHVAAMANDPIIKSILKNKFAIKDSSLQSDSYKKPTEEGKPSEPPEPPEPPDIQVLIEELKQQTSNDQWRKYCDLVVEYGIGRIKDNLNLLGVQFDSWVYESKLTTSQKLEKLFAKDLHQHTYRDEDNTLWFRATEFGDEKDRVLIRKNNIPTYFAYDLHYHLQKVKQKYDTLINVWGSDHHGYVNRLTSSLKTLANSDVDLRIMLVQFVVLKNQEGLLTTLSTRKGTAVPLVDLVSATSPDIVKVYYLLRSHNQHMEFDLKQATTFNNQNPYYYIQYAHARCATIFKEAEARGIIHTDSNRYTFNREGDEHISIKQLINALLRFPEMIEASATQLSAHLPLSYLRELAGLFHAFYNEVPILVSEEHQRNNNMILVKACQHVLSNGMNLYAIKPLERLERLDRYDSPDSPDSPDSSNPSEQLEKKSTR